MKASEAFNDSKDAVWLCRLQSKAIRDNWLLLDGMFYFIDKGDWNNAMEEWAKIDFGDQGALLLAPTKGGIFTTEERKMISEMNWSAIRKNRQEKG